MVAIEFTEKGSAAKIVQEALKHNVLLLTAGPREVIRFLPPLIIKREELEHGLEVFAKCLKAVFSEKSSNGGIFSTIGKLTGQ